MSFHDYHFKLTEKISGNPQGRAQGPLGPLRGLGIRGFRIKNSACKIWCKMVGVIKVSGPFLVQHGWVGQRGYAYFLGFKAFSVKSTFEPITPPLKWVLANVACKVSVNSFEYRVNPSWDMQNGAKQKKKLLKIFVFATSCQILWVYC